MLGPVVHVRCEINTAGGIAPPRTTYPSRVASRSLIAQRGPLLRVSGAATMKTYLRPR